MKKVKAWETSDGETFSTVEDAQKHELDLILKGADLGDAITDDKGTDEIRSSIVDLLLEKADDVVNILTLKDDSRPAARTASGRTGTGRRRRNQEAPATPAAPEPDTQTA